MFLRDEVALNYFAGAILLTFPWIGISWGVWGTIWEMLMLLAVVLFGRRRGLFITALLLLLGYAAPIIVLGGAVFKQATFIPLAGLVVIYGKQKGWSVQATFFWGAMAAAVLGAIPTLSFLQQGFDSKTVDDMTNLAVKQYDASGLLTAIQKQGITEAQVHDSLQQFIHFYGLIIPSLAAIFAIGEYGIIFYVMRRWYKDKGRIPFTRWRLPWYAAWGGILGIACYLLGDQFSWPVINGLGINLMIVYASIAFVLGISVYLYILNLPSIPRILKYTLIVASIIYFFFSVVSIVMFGLFDLVFNFRRLPEET